MKYIMVEQSVDGYDLFCYKNGEVVHFATFSSEEKAQAEGAKFLNGNLEYA